LITSSLQYNLGIYGGWQTTLRAARMRGHAAN
jgi:hypothetical protein